MVLAKIAATRTGLYERISDKPGTACPSIAGGSVIVGMGSMVFTMNPGTGSSIVALRLMDYQSTRYSLSRPAGGCASYIFDKI